MAVKLMTKNNKSKKPRKRNIASPVLPIPPKSKAQNIDELIKEDRKKDRESKKWLITINNPNKKDLTHERIKELLGKRKSIIYWCMASEISKTRTPHTHLFIYGATKIRRSTLKKLFGNVRYDGRDGTCKENRDYVFKQGLRCEEWGKMPDEEQDTQDSKLAILRLAEEGLNALQIVRRLKKYELHYKIVENLVDSYHKDKYSFEDRELEVTFVVTRNVTVMTKSIKRCYGRGAVYRARSEQHCFDEYKYQEVLLFENFDDTLFDIEKMNAYLDGQSGVFLPARNNNRPACYKKVFITSRTGLELLYSQYKEAKGGAWQELIGKIHNVWVQKNDGIVPYTINEYFIKYAPSIELPTITEQMKNTTFKLPTKRSSVKRKH